ncbi:response regulator [Chitinophaga sedimenti]|uniref:response regulator transcription factor n=1 Tax=Chitinophaga sedimenti TaxID=2033606 RepID=UPI0020037A7D|nr:response regulator [Chitinophaga sedimenti]MCK7553667.1 response regulator [Chitinophaga sedimenti]
MKVLIIEDERAMAAEMEVFLKKYYVCDLAYNARQGLQKMEENQYDFILLDLGLPDKDGLAVLQEARKNCPDASCIILTARGQIEDRIRGWTSALMIIFRNLFRCWSCSRACRRLHDVNSG